MSDPFARARAATAAEFDALAQRTFAAHAALRSAALCVAQYWDDEADDAVHYELVWSTRSTPEWPHACDETPTTLCAWCAAWPFDDSLRLRWHDNGDAIDRFAAFCKPDCDQGMSVGEAYTPYAIARPDQPVEVVGRVLQPDWMAPAVVLAEDEELAALLAQVYAAPAEDLPRQVLADWLQDRDDPRGEFIARSLAGAAPATGPDFWHAHPVTQDIQYHRGFPWRVAIELEGRADLIRYGGHPAWSTVEVLDVGRSRPQIFTEAMCRVRRVENLLIQNVWNLSGLQGLPLRELHVIVAWLYGLIALRVLAQHTIEHLELMFTTDASERFEELAGRTYDFRVAIPRVTVDFPGDVSPIPHLRRFIDADTWAIA